MKLPIRPLELVLPGAEGSPGLVLGLMRGCWCQTWLLGAACQWWAPKPFLACRMGAGRAVPSCPGIGMEQLCWRESTGEAPATSAALPKEEPVRQQESTGWAWRENGGNHCKER